MKDTCFWKIGPSISYNELLRFLAELEPRLCLPFVYTAVLEQEDK